MIYDCITQTIGNTPLVRLNHLGKGLSASILLKQEACLPGGSVKDRVGLHLIDDAEARGVIETGVTTLVEPTSGNSGIALAMVAAVKGYKLIIVMPESCSMERRVVLRAYGAEIHLTPAEAGMKGACAYAKAFVEKTENTYLLDQFGNPANPKIHEMTTGPEIWRDTDGHVDCFIAAAGTGGTITGVARHLKAQNPDVKIIAVEPEACAPLSGGEIGPHYIQGIGTGFIPDTLDTSLIDEVMTVSCKDALSTSRKLARAEGMLSGISSGANVFVAMQVAKRPEMAGKTIVTIQCSNGERYLSSPLFKRLSDECAAMETRSL
jgi:cysteine synthase